MQTINYEIIKKLLKGGYQYSTYSEYSRIYPFTNEPLYVYFDTMNFIDKSVLTVMSSGDHALLSIAEDASNIDCFDINILTEYYYHLKTAAIQILNYNEYIHYFTSLIPIKNNESIDASTLNFILDRYKILRKYLNDEVRRFWDFIIINSDITKSISNLFRHCPIPQIRNSITESHYNKLKERLPNHHINNFFDGNIISLPEKLEKQKYDYMLLSNIVNPIYYNQYCIILSELINNLNDNGRIVLFSFQGIDYIEDVQANYKHELPFITDNYSLSKQGTISIVRKRYR